MQILWRIFLWKTGDEISNGRVMPDFFACGRYLPSLPSEDSYSKGLYTTGIGGVDVVTAISENNQPFDYFTTHVIPGVMANRQGHRGFNPNLTHTICCGVPGLSSEKDLTCGDLT
ncbi:hypothetical protein R1flu_011439 [Riccia fluitans]|uniref:Uncharacterized protein n=1 Tax=Riccia fluitans TaxID=41844 RepID=A0ABD1ZB32_9MARC